MRTTCLLALACTIGLMTPLLAGENREKAEAAFFKAYYLEHGKRDLAKAEAAYTEFLWEYEEERDLAVRAFLGLARIGAHGGKKDAEFRIEEVENILAQLEGKLPEEVLASLRREIAETKALTAAADQPQGVLARLRALTGDMEEGPVNTD